MYSFYHLFFGVGSSTSIPGSLAGGMYINSSQSQEGLAWAIESLMGISKNSVWDVSKKGGAGRMDRTG